MSPTQRMLRFFEFKHLPAHLQEPSRAMHYVAHKIESEVPDGPEKTAGMRKLLEAKDCFVRALLPEGE